MKFHITFLLVSLLFLVGCNNKTLYFSYESGQDNPHNFVELQLLKSGEYQQYSYQSLATDNDSLNYGNVFTGKYFFVGDSLFLTSTAVSTEINSRVDINKNDFHAAYYFKEDNLVQFEPFGYSMYFLEGNLSPGKALKLREYASKHEINWWLIKNKVSTGILYLPIE